MWYQKFDTYVLSLGFQWSKFDHCVYFKTDSGHILIIALYVDNMLLFGNGYLISNMKSQLFAHFEMKGLGATRYILGIDIRRDKDNIKLWLSQHKYGNLVLERFNMNTCRSMIVPVALGMELSMEDCPKSPFEVEDMEILPYPNAVDSLMYDMVCTRLNIV